MGKRSIIIKKRRFVVLLLGILILAGSAFNMEADAASVLCARGKNVNDQIENVTVSHQKRDYNGSSENW